MPVPAIKSLAKKAGKSEKEAEKLWKKAVAIAEDERGKKEKDFNDKDFAYTMGIFKNMIGVKERKTIEEVSFMKGNKTFTIEDSGGTWEIIEIKGIDYLVRNIDLNHFAMKLADSSGASHTYSVEAFRDKPDFYDALKKWLRGDEMIGGKAFDEKKEKSFFESSLTAKEWLEEEMTSTPFSVLGIPENPVTIKTKEEQQIDLSTIKDALMKGTITPGEVFDNLVSQGYSEEDAVIEVNSLCQGTTYPSNFTLADIH